MKIPPKISKSEFLILKSKNRRVRFGFIGFMACLIMALSWSVLGISATQESQIQGLGKGGFKTSDLPANVLFTDSDKYDLQSDGLYDPAVYFDGEEKVSCFIGRREGQFVLVTSNRSTSGRMLCLYSDPEICDIPFTGCRVARMATARIKDGGADLRELKQSVGVPINVELYDNRQNFWKLEYSNVLVIPYDVNGDGMPESWDITTDGTSSLATVLRITKWKKAFCDDVPIPFHLTVTLQ